MRVLRSFGLVVMGVLVVLLAGEIGLRALSSSLPQPSPWPSAATELKARQLENAMKFDVVFLGSSVTEAAVDPALLDGVSAYNAALPFSSPFANEVWLQLMFSDLDGTVVVLGLPAWPFHGESEEDLLAGQIGQAVTGEASPFDTFHLYRNRGVLADWFSMRSRMLTVNSGSWTGAGHQTAYYDRAGDTIVGRFPPYGPPRMSEEAEAAMRRMADSVERAGGEVVLMVEPGRYPGAVDPDLVSEYLDSLGRLASSMGASFWDTYSMEWNPDLFADEAHFNRSGTEEFSRLTHGFLRDLSLSGSS